jgi:Protein of unknown function (DUF1592)/Protein of unknown function (DUF1588)/Protein of unknown function (DUF1587)/Protein of unknown function (DUF1585)/Protein of unknown function (DUF1595)
MNHYASATLVAGLLLVGLAPDSGLPPAATRPASTSAVVVPSPPAGGAELNPIIQKYCAKRCHNKKRLRGNMTLEQFDLTAPERAPELAEKMIHKLRAGMMPPARIKRPAGDTLLMIASLLEGEMDALAEANPNPGSRTFQRLNRAEYERAVKDLLGVDVDASAFLPSETISENFDNIADMQMLSATLMEGYMRAASHVSRVALGDPNATPSSTVYKVSKTASQMVHVDGAPIGTRGGVSVVHTFPADGDYVFELELHPEPTGNLYGLTSADEQLEVSINGERVAILDIDRWMSESDPTGMRIETDPIRVRAGPQRISAAFIQKFEGPVDDLITPVDYTLADTQIGTAYGVTTAPHLRDMTISGPFAVTGVSDTPSRERIFTCRPTAPDEERPCAESIVARLGERAYRRPLEDHELADLMGFFEQGRSEGGFEVGVRSALHAILASPYFVFRLEPTPAGVKPGDIYPIDDLALASRLSFFLWALPPDEELIGVAEAGRLSDEGTLIEQARRMIADPRSEALSTRFASQWLRLQDLDKIHPDAQLYPYYDARLADAMKRETQMFFYDLVKNDRSLMDLLTADYTYVNERLAGHYGMPDVSGNEMRKVHVSDPNRQGLLGQGSILMMTSHANRTSPVLRGKWVMEVLLGSPPPPPPPNVPAFEETAGAENGRELTTRERMEQHRAAPACQPCHRVIDPIGLALDNFDVTGAWRIKENGMPVDAVGELYDGTPLANPSDLRGALLKLRTVFVRTFTRNMMAYALGRRVEYFDMPTVRKIERDAAEHDYRLSSFILGVVRSPAFRMSRMEAVADEVMQK